MRSLFAAIALASLLAATSADARPRHHHRHYYRGNFAEQGQPYECRGIAWCGCWLRLYLRIPDPRRVLDRASAWYGVGRRVFACQVNAIAVWPHHVGLVTACLGSGQIQMISGNDGNAVRDRVRSSRGAQFRAL